MADFLINTRIILNYLIPNNDELYEAVRVLFFRRNWEDDQLSIKKYALGEVLNRVLTHEYDSDITMNSLIDKIDRIRDLVAQKHLRIIDFNSVGWNG